MRNVYLAWLLIGFVHVHADEPSHVLMDQKYWACEESKSLEGGIYGKGPFKRFGPPGACAEDKWQAVSQKDFKRLAVEWYGFDWSEEIPFWQRSGVEALNESRE